MNRSRKRANSSSAYDHIKGAILSGALRPLEGLTEEQIAGRLGLSRTPVREAFTLLAAEGLIETVPKRGSFVSELNVDDILEIYQIRLPLERMTVRIAAEALSDAELEELERLVETEMSHQGDAAHAAESLAASAGFHDIINGAAQNKRLETLLKQLQGQVHRARVLWPSTVSRLVETWREHEATLRALKVRDPDEAERRMYEHLEKARQATLVQMKPTAR